MKCIELPHFFKWGGGWIVLPPMKIAPAYAYVSLSIFMK